MENAELKMSNSPKITAEWVIRAQLTICQSENSSNDQSIIERRFDGENPIKVVFKWCPNDENFANEAAVVETILSAPKQSSQLSSKDSGSFRSSGMMLSDSGVDTTRTTLVNNSEHSKSILISFKWFHIV